MTGYMFRNAEYRRSLLQSLDSSAPAALTDGVSGDLPPVSGKIKVNVMVRGGKLHLRSV